MLYLQLLQLVSDVYRSALYVWVTEGVPPAPFTRRDLDDDWRINAEASQRTR
ncbi:MAG: hypothetical protein QM756_06520 [Polyangiaceae bacterium]